MKLKTNPQLESWLKMRRAMLISSATNDAGQRFTLYLVNQILPMTVMEDPRFPEEPWIFGPVNENPKLIYDSLHALDKLLGLE